MARIRTVKPSLLKHEDLFDLEMATGMPLRIAFVGLFTCCDREGRFVWKPRTLKTDVLPHDSVDFSRVLDALASCDFVRKYAVDGVEYGVIPTFKKHQVINNKELKSELPEPTENSYITSTCTREERVNNAIPSDLNFPQGEGKGNMEGKGIEPLVPSESKTADALAAQQLVLTATPSGKPKREDYPADFERTWSLYPARFGGNPKKETFTHWNARRREGVTVEEMIAGVERYAVYCKAAGKTGTEYVMQGPTFFGTSKRYAEPWPVGRPPDARSAPSADLKFRPNAADHSSSNAAMARSMAQHGVVVDDMDDIDFN